MAESVVTINPEIGHPTVEEARQMLKAELEKCRNRKIIAVKVIRAGMVPAVLVAHYVKASESLWLAGEKRAA
jgi:hypothetical protein